MRVQSSIGTVLESIILTQTGLDMSCPECKDEINTLNTMAPDAVLRLVNKFAGRIVNRAMVRNQPWYLRLCVSVAPKFAISVVEDWIRQACRLHCDGTWPIEVFYDLRVPKDKPRSYLNGMGSAPVVTPLTALQMSLHATAKVASPPVADPFTGTPSVHFAAHLWPVRGIWQWHIDRWNEVAKTINGRLCVGIVTDEATDQYDDVVAKLDPRFECFEAVNSAGGENPTFRKLLTMIPRSHNDVMIYCHGKGVRPHTANSESVRIWTEMMYETVVFNQQKIINVLADGYKCFGSFRTFGDVPLAPANRWHYSGTFFAVRTRHLMEVAVKNEYGGVEAWPGDRFKAAEAWCEFADSPGLCFGYDMQAMYPAIVDAQMDWEAARIGGPRCEQHKRELEWFLALIDDTFGEHVHRYGKTFPVRVLVIGSRNGGLEYQLQQRGHTTVSIDIAPRPDNTTGNMIVGCSHNEATQAEARAHGPYDVVFIDGDHSYDGVRADYWFAQSLNPPLIALHDIHDTHKHRSDGCEVERLWKEIKQAGRLTAEKIVGCGWGGIGIVWRDRHEPSILE